MTEPLYRLPNGNGITLEDVRDVWAASDIVGIRKADGSALHTPSDDPPHDRDALIEAVNAARARQAERDRRFIVLTDISTQRCRIINRDHIVEVFPNAGRAGISLIKDDFFTTVETFAEVAAMLGVKL